MSGVRIAAARLYALHEADREAVLAGLSAQEAAPLRSALDELAQLGFEPAALAQCHDEADGANSPIERFKQLDGAALARILRAEPASLIADVLALGAWPWLDDFLDQLPLALRDQVRRAMADGRVAAPARRAWLLQALPTRLGEMDQAGMAAPAVAAARWKRWIRWAA